MTTSDHNDALRPRAMLTLPAPLQQAIAAELAAVPQIRWVREAQALSERYRAERNDNSTPLASGPLQALAYAALLLPPSYAQVRGAAAATAARIPGWQPRTVLDLGSGPGTALWAVAEQWPSLQQATAVEREAAFVALGRTLARAGEAALFRNIHWERADLRNLAALPAKRYDLVVVGHVLNELAPDDQRALVAWAWQRTDGVLLLIEPGNSASFAHLRAARDHLLGLGAHTVAPCAHDTPCPLVDDWCHVPQRLKRPPFQRLARGAPSEWEDAKYTYAAMARFLPELPIWARVIREPQVAKGYVDLQLSTASGVEQVRLQKRDKSLFRWAKDLEWGTALDRPLNEQPDTTR